MTPPRLGLTREQILAYRRSVNALDVRLPAGATSLERAAWAGLQDSMPRAAVLSIHARVEGTAPTTWEDPSLVQLWGPRFSAYVVAARDRAVFTLARLTENARRRRLAEDLARRLAAFLDGRTMTYNKAGRGLGVNPNELRYAATTGTVLMRWEGAGQPTIWTVPRPDVDPGDARFELARRYLHVFGPATADGFGEWAGIGQAGRRAAWDALAGSLTAVRTPVGDAWILSSDEPSFGGLGGPPADARLLPSGDAYFLLHGADRELLVPDAGHRGRLWTPRIWPGAVLAGGEIVGTWRRANADVTIASWRRPSPAERGAIEQEALSLPMPDLRTGIRVHWDG